MEPFTRARPLAYLSTLFVDPAARGAGLGGALVDAAHRELDAAGVAVTCCTTRRPVGVRTVLGTARGSSIVDNVAGPSGGGAAVNPAAPVRLATPLPDGEVPR